MIKYPAIATKKNPICVFVKETKDDVRERTTRACRANVEERKVASEPSYHRWSKSRDK